MERQEFMKLKKGFILLYKSGEGAGMLVALVQLIDDPTDAPHVVVEIVQLLIRGDQCTDGVGDERDARPADLTWDKYYPGGKRPE